ncbi:MAG TPA: hypothetical protein VF805_07705 [Anaeromyxobacteraceae bacterium]
MPMYVMKSTQRSNRVLGALAAALWMAPAVAQTASGAGGATSGSEPDRSGQATAEPDSQTTTRGTGSGGERDRTAVMDSETTAGTGSTSETSGTSTTAKDQVRSILDEDPGRWPYAGRSSSDRGR